MPKLTIGDAVGSRRKSPEPVAKLPGPKPCPRCRVTLEVERTYTVRGLSGVPSVEHVYRCPACDARYHYSQRDDRWRPAPDLS
jgi:hypothetical protein